jgi:hypothetical protein
VTPHSVGFAGFGRVLDAGSQAEDATAITY